MYWVREVIGWALVALGLGMFFVIFLLLQRDPETGVPSIFEAFILLFPSIFVFRGGIHLLKVAVAARICAQADGRLYPATPVGEGPRATRRQ